MLKTRYYIKFLVVFLLIFIISSKSSFAENEEGFSVMPFYSNVVVDEKDIEKGIDLQFTNHSSYSAVLKLSVVDFGTLDETGGLVFVGEGNIFSDTYGLASWVVLQKDSLVLASGETQTIHITIQNRESLSPGGHYAAVVAKLDEFVSDTQEKSSDIAFNPSFTSLIFARKLGGEIYDLDLKDFSIEKSFLGIPKKVRLRFQNKGNVHVVPRGTIEIIDPLGKEVQKGIINLNSSIVLPEAFRVIPVSLQSIEKIFIPGKYTVSIQYRFEGNDTFLIQQKTFFYVPWLFLAVIFLIFFAGSFFIWWRRKKNDRGR